MKMKFAINQFLKIVMMMVLWGFAEPNINIGYAQTSSELLKHIDKIHTSNQAVLKAASIDTFDGESGYSIRFESKVKLDGIETLVIESHSVSYDEPYYLTQCFGDEKKDYSSIFDELVKKLVSKYPKLKLDDSNNPGSNHSIYSDIKRIASLNNHEGSEVITLEIWSGGGMKVTIR